MTTTLNASTSSGLVATPDNSGAIALQNNGTTGLLVNASGQVTMPLNVCFSAVFSGGANTTQIIFQTAYVNIGSAYSTSTGNFTAPVAGTYQFTFSGYAQTNALTIGLKLNGTTKAICQPLAASTASQTVFLTLAVGDVVGVYSGGNQVYGDNNGYTIFSGRLIQ
jgi:hypothetical protein